MSDINNALGINNGNKVNMQSQMPPYQQMPEVPESSNQTSNQNNNNSIINLSTGDNIAESTLSAFAYIILVVGVAGSVFFGGSLLDSNVTRAIGCAMIGLGSLISVIAWATMMLLINISNNAKAIKHLLASQKQ